MNECFFIKAGLACPYGKFCADRHSDDKPSEIEELRYLERMFNSVTKGSITKKEFIEFYNKLYRAINTYVNTKKFMIEYKTHEKVPIAANSNNNNVRSDNDNIILQALNSPQVINNSISIECSLFQSKLQEEIKKITNAEEDGLLNINIRQTFIQN
jgi:CRISPR/Cas system-associated endoribonuclease Cas2